MGVTAPSPSDVESADESDGGPSGDSLSARALVVVTNRGLRIHPPVLRPLDPPAEVIVLSVSDLGVLARLSAGEPVDRAEPLRRRLADAGLLIERAREPERISAAAPAPVGGNGAGPDGFDPSHRHLLETPVVLRVRAGGFELLDHDGRIQVRVGPIEALALHALATPGSIADAHERHCGHAGDEALDSDAFSELADRLWTSGLLHREDLETRQLDPATAEYRQALVRRQRFIDLVDEGIERHEIAEAQRRAETGLTRVPVVPVLASPHVLPLALGMILATMRHFEDGRLAEYYDLHPRWMVQPKGVERYLDRHAIFLFSNYVWDHGKNLAMSEHIKEAHPGAITVHGGPDTPKFPHDNEAYFRANPHVDITVHGEGEITAAEMLAALAPALVAAEDRSSSVDLSALEEVPGLSFRIGDRVVRSPSRDRIEDFDQAPSPFQSDIFDCFGESEAVRMAIVETNRGCPYGCTYCDWGSATASRIRKFPMERVFAELEWCARNRVPRLTIADANFGIWARDVEIAQRVAELKAQYDYPEWFATNYAKNTVKHLRDIVQIMLDAGIHTEGLLSLQSMDSDTLDVINRSNIKLDKYEELAREFRRHDMPLFVDLMLGLPGQTLGAFRNDLQECINREVTAKVFPTQMLVNSPMNEPEYRTRFRIQTDNDDETARSGSNHKAMVVASASFTRGDYEQMLLTRRAFLVLENYGVLRHVGRFVRQETGVKEVAFIATILAEAVKTPDRWPTISYTLLTSPDVMTPPASWGLLIDEIGQFLRTELGVADDEALATVLAVQHALLPTRGRHFPLRLELAHDFAAWHAAMLDAKDQDRIDDWETVVPRLRDYGPASFVVDDPNGLCHTNFGFSIDGSSYNDWELDSPVARPMPAEYLISH